MSEPDDLPEFARRLRRHRTEPEQFAWTRLRGRRFAGFKFVRQAPLGIYIADFLCRSAKWVIELDGGGHNTPEARSHDVERTGWLESQGYFVLRFWNHQVMTDWPAVEDAVWAALHGKRPAIPSAYGDSELGKRRVDP